MKTKSLKIIKGDLYFNNGFAWKVFKKKGEKVDLEKWWEDNKERILDYRKKKYGWVGYDIDKLLS